MGRWPRSSGGRLLGPVRGSKLRAELTAQLLREGGQALNYAVALGHVENPLHPFSLVAKPRIGLFQRWSFPEVRHTPIVPFPLLQANFGRFGLELSALGYSAAGRRFRPKPALASNDSVSA
jgi:hypothetical protein